MTRDADAPLGELARGFRQRTLVTAKLAAKLGSRYLKASLGVDGAQKNGKAVRTAEELVREMGRLKGLVMKFGQIASYMPGAMSPEAQAILARLQAESTPMATEVVLAELARELGAPAGELFEELEPEPFAAASIGQVHRGRWNGRAVAVKVQYPGIEALVASDLSTVGWLARVSTLGTAIDSEGAVNELAARLLEECDYRIEARNQSLFAKLWAPHPERRVPEVIGERSSRRVLTSELSEGMSLHTFAKRAAKPERDRAGVILFETCFSTLFGHAVYNADPHPGNYLVDPDGSVTFLDYGCVRWFEARMIDNWKRVALSVLDGRQRDFRESYIELGLGPKGKFDWDHQWQVMQYLYRPFLQKEPFTYTNDYVRQSYSVLLLDNPNRMRSPMPPEWLFLNRLQWGLNAVLAELEATGPWPEIWRRAVESPTEPLSREEPGDAPR
jgi:predicted unusual protein kinase regulating ubiquinone biosynthesis (AarF/ABC1/UbiB family)